MSKTSKTNIDLRHDLSTDFVQNLAADWKENGRTTISEVRKKMPDRYCELIAKVVPKEMLISSDRPPSEFSSSQSQAEIAVKLLVDIGTPAGSINQDMIQRAIEAQQLFVAELERIASIWQ